MISYLNPGILKSFEKVVDVMKKFINNCLLIAGVLLFSIIILKATDDAYRGYVMSQYYNSSYNISSDNVVSKGNAPVLPNEVDW